jgi:hypothetical protein
VTDFVVQLGDFRALERARRSLFAGPFDVLFAEGDYMEPDLVFVRPRPRRDII